VLGTLVSTWWGWGLFTLESTLVLVVAGWIAAGLGSLVGVLAVPVAAPLLVAAIMIYCRLLGRVVWIGSGTKKKKVSGTNGTVEA